MKIAISISTPDQEAAFDGHFGRAGAFLIHDTETKLQQVVPNPAAQAGGGAGIQAAEFLVREGISAVISGSFGPKASGVLRAAGVQLYATPSAALVDLMANFEQGSLKPAGGV